MQGVSGGASGFALALIFLGAFASPALSSPTLRSPVCTCGGVDLSIITSMSAVHPQHQIAPPTSQTQVAAPISMSATLPALHPTSDIETKKHAREECTEDLFKKIVIQTEIVAEVITEMKGPYTEDNFGCTYEELANCISVENDALNICDVDQRCDQVLPIVHDLSHLTPENFAVLNIYLSQTLVFVSEYLMAFEQFFLDETLLGDSFYTEDIMNVHKNLEVLNNYVKQAVEACGATPDDSHLWDLQSMMFINTTEIYQNLRGFMVLRQTLMGAELIGETFYGVAFPEKHKGLLQGLGDEDEGKEHVKLGNHDEEGNEKQGQAHWKELESEKEEQERKTKEQKR